jgi:hypothetical protein
MLGSPPMKAATLRLLVVVNEARITDCGDRAIGSTKSGNPSTAVAGFAHSPPMKIGAGARYFATFAGEPCFEVKRIP